MNGDPIKKLAEIFQKFPGIGPRQALRMVYFLINQKNGLKKDLVNQINLIDQQIQKCTWCGRHSVSVENQDSKICQLCQSYKREKNQLMVVAHDTDIEAIEKTSSYQGKYFVLGGLIPILEKNPEEKIDQLGLLNRIKIAEKDGLKEIILALNATAEGDNTLEYLNSLLSPLKKNGVKITFLGRGLSTGTELEYSDSNTIKNALENRHQE